jgi:hypothetical protein
MGTIERLFFEISNTCIPYNENLSLEQYYATPTPENKKISLASFIERIHAEDMKTLRMERNKRLTETDWTQTNDVRLENDEEWVAYRSLLRDLPANTEDPTKPEWPEPPQVKVVPGKTKLEKIQAELTETKNALDDERTLHETTRAELTETKSALETDLEEKTYQIISLEARMQALEQKILAAN